MQSLNISRIELRDYRCFDSIEVRFDERLTVLVASNGLGKTSILDAIAIALAPYVGAFDEGVGKGFESSDIRQTRVRSTQTNEMEHAPAGVSLEATGWIPGSLAHALGAPSTWARSLSGPTKAKTTIKDAKELIAYGKRQQEAVRSGAQDELLPVIVHHGTGRLWQQKKLTAGKLARTSRTTGYTDCLDPASRYKSFEEWFSYWSRNRLEKRLVAGEANIPYTPNEFDAFIESVGAAVGVCLKPAGWDEIAYSPSRQTLVARHTVHGELPVELLSDGIRNMIGMVADIAFRATKLNPQLGSMASRQTPGVVLIDEVDMHLHPEWQQVVLTCLQEAFPRMQLIVTTHSPQVLSTVRRENIRVLARSATGVYSAEPPLLMTYGEPSGDVMHSVMGVDPQPPVEEREDLQRLTELVDQGACDAEEVTALQARLRERLGESHPQLQRIQRSMNRQRALKS